MNVLQYIQGIRDFSLDRPSAVTLGKFDGVHMGHQKLIEMIQEKAKQENLLSVVFTFDKIPALPAEKPAFYYNQYRTADVSGKTGCRCGN